MLILRICLVWLSLVTPIITLQCFSHRMLGRTLLQCDGFLCSCFNCVFQLTQLSVRTAVYSFCNCRVVFTHCLKAMNSCFTESSLSSVVLVNQTLKNLVWMCTNSFIDWFDAFDVAGEIFMNYKNMLPSRFLDFFCFRKLCIRELITSLRNNFIPSLTRCF